MSFEKYKNLDTQRDLARKQYNLRVDLFAANLKKRVNGAALYSMCCGELYEQSSLKKQKKE
jgi:hypothetical protein